LILKNSPVICYHANYIIKKLQYTESHGKPHQNHINKKKLNKMKHGVLKIVMEKFETTNR